MSEVFSDPGVGRYFRDPKQGAEETMQAVVRIFDGRVGPQSLNVLRMLAVRQRTEIIPLIYEAFQTLVRQARGIVVADVTTAIEVDDAEKERIAEHLARMTGSTRVAIRTHVNPNIIGGFVARVGDQLIDGSVSTSLQQLRHRLP
jgi:F-type H+-transporting ATPase subunit delta